VLLNRYVFHYFILKLLCRIYDEVEVKPGYHLNMVLGPNGTGKSAIVCATLLVLGGKLKTLERADLLSSYIKNGCEKSLIEIELYDPKRGNVVIKRIFTKNDSKFYICDNPATPKEVNIFILIVRPLDLDPTLTSFLNIVAIYPKG